MVVHLLSITIPNLKSFDTLVKRKVRTQERDFIKSSLLREREPHKLHVLCLPSSEAIEVTDIWDRLHVPRENIVGIEQDKKRCIILEARKLGIHLIEGDLYKSASDGSLAHAVHEMLHIDAFDVVNLDLQSYFSRDVAATIRWLRTDGLLAENSVFMITYLRGRENADAKRLIEEQDCYDRFVYKHFKPEYVNAYGEWRRHAIKFQELCKIDWIDRLDRRKLRLGIDNYIIDALLGLDVIKAIMYEVLVTESEPLMIGSTVDKILEILKKEVDDGHAFCTRDAWRIAYQSGHSPMRVLMLKLKRLHEITSLDTAMTILGKYVPPCIKIDDTGAMEPDRDVKHRITQMIEKGEVISHGKEQ